MKYGLVLVLVLLFSQISVAKSLGVGKWDDSSAGRLTELDTEGAEAFQSIDDPGTGLPEAQDECTPPGFRCYQNIECCSGDCSDTSNPSLAYACF